MIDVYAQNTNLPHPSIQSGHISESTGHPLEPGGIAEKGDPYFRPYVPKGIYQNVAFKDLPVIAQGNILKQKCLQNNIPFPDGVRNMGKFTCGILNKQEMRGYDVATTTHAHLCYALNISLKSSHRHWSGLKKTGMIIMDVIHHPKHGPQMTMRYSKEAYIKQDWDIREYQEPFKKGRNSRGGVLPKMTNTPPPETQAGSAFQRPLTSKSNQKDLYLCSGKNKKPVTKIDEKEKKDVARTETSFETPEQPQDKISLKSNEAKGNTEPLSETPTKSPEREEVKKEKPTQSSRIQVSTKPQTGRTEKELNAIAEEVYEEFLVLFKPEEDKRFACHKTDFIRMTKARTKSHLGCAKDIKTYMRKFSINQYLMGKRLGSNGKFFQPSLYALFSKTIINDYQQKEYSKYFTPYNELDLSKREGASFPTEKAEEVQEPNKTTQDAEKVLGDVSSPFDEAVKKHLLQMVPYITYKAWIIDANAFFEEAELGWKVTAKGQFSKNQIETKFGQFIDWAHRSYEMRRQVDKT